VYSTTETERAQRGTRFATKRTKGTQTSAGENGDGANCKEVQNEPNSQRGVFVKEGRVGMKDKNGLIAFGSARSWPHPMPLIGVPDSSVGALYLRMQSIRLFAEWIEIPDDGVARRPSSRTVLTAE
jgi:hypothetical protein